MLVYNITSLGFYTIANDIDWIVFFTVELDTSQPVTVRHICARASGRGRQAVDVAVDAACRLQEPTTHDHSRRRRYGRHVELDV